MADNTELNAGSGGDTISTDDIAGVKVQRVKVQYGVDGSATDVSDSNPLPIDDAGGSITVDGTVDLGATDNAVLDSIDAAVNGTLSVDLGANNDVTVTGTVDLGATDNAVLDTIATNTGSAIPAGSNTIGEVTIGTATTAATDLGKAVDAAAGGSDVGVAALAVRDDSLSTLTPADGDYTPLRVSSTGALHVTGGGGGTEYNEDAATPSTITGTATMMERDDALSSLTPVEGDWAAMRCDSQGALWVNAVNADGTSAVDTASGGTDSGAVMLAVRDDSLTTLTPVDGDYTTLRVSSTGALHVTGGGGGTEYTEDVATPNPIVGTATLMERDDALSTLTPVEGDWAGLRCNANGALWTAVNGTVTVDGSGVTQPVSGTVTANLSATDNAVLDSIDSAVNGTLTVDLGANNDVTVTGTVDLGATDNAVLDSIVTNTTGLAGCVSGSELQVDIVSAPTLTVDLGANNDVTVTGDTLTALQLIDNPIVAHDAAASGSTGVNMGGAIATNSVEGITQVANADATRVTADLNGCLVTRPHTTLEEIITERVSNTNGTSTAFTNFAAGGAGVHNYITTITIWNSSATDGYVDFRDGTAGSVIFTAPAPTVGGSVINLPVPLKGAANTALAYDVSGALSTVYISVVGFQAQG